MHRGNNLCPSNFASPSLNARYHNNLRFFVEIPVTSPANAASLSSLSNNINYQVGPLFRNKYYQASSLLLSLYSSSFSFLLSMSSQQTSPGHIGDCPRYNSHSGKLEPTVVMLRTEPHPKALTQPLPAYAPPPTESHP